ncbi:MAG: outer membrane beta-barrel family protein [Bacteroidota bacterium]|nr:outer membrane beta-barrel family protein [Bacteroidota bacterium]
MIKNSLFILFLTSFSISHAQNTPCFNGFIKDTISNAPLSKVSIEAFSPDNLITVLKFTSSDTTGKFKICLQKKVLLRFTRIGYQTIEMLIDFSDTNVNLNNKLIFLSPMIEAIKGAGVSMKRKEVEKIEADKKVYSLENNALTNGGTAIDALRQIPAINVDGDGSISLRGSDQVTIYINGKQSSLSGADRQAMLMQIPAANIESIEVNTSPGAKQDAEGVSGIINITLKQNKTKGENGFVSIGAGNNEKYNATVNHNINFEKWSFSNTLSLRQNNLWGRGYNERDNFYGDTSFLINKYSSGDNLTQNAAISGFIDFKPNKKWLFSANYIASYNVDKNTETNQIQFSDKQKQLTNIQSIDNTTKNPTLNYDAGLMVKKTFDKLAHNLVAIVNYSYTDKINNIDIIQNELDVFNYQPILNRPTLLYNNAGNKFANTLLQLDYTKPIKDYMRLELGAKYTGRDFDNTFIIDSFNYQTQNKEIDNSRSNQFVYSENVSAAYAMLSHTFNEMIKYNIGLRVENTNVVGEEKSSNLPVNFNYTNLFPSGNIAFTLQKKYNFPDLQIGYSRRINRPTQNQINPFTNVNDPYNLFRGNPELKPELTDAIELSGFYNSPKVVYTANLYWRQTNSVIWRYRTVDSLGISNVSFYNLDFNRSMGAEFITRFTLLKKVKTTMNLNLFRQQVQGNVMGSGFATDQLMVTGKVNASYAFWKNAEIQTSYGYMGPRLTPQGKILSMYGLEFGFKKDIIKDKFSFSASLTDVFDNRRFKIVMEDYNFESSVYRKRETRFVTVNLTWKFGSSTPSSERKPKIQERGPEMDF